MNKTNILITGATGFIGKALVSRLNQEAEFKIFIFDRQKYGSIEQKKALDRFESENIKHVFHLAGKTFVPDSWENPIDFMNVNVLGTQNILEFCRTVKASLTYLSGYLYGRPESLPIPESALLKPNNPYALSKSLAEKVCQFYFEHYDVSLCVLRPFNVIGENQDHQWLIPEIISQLSSPDVSMVRLRGLAPKRDYVYVDDVAEAILLSYYFAQGGRTKQNIFNIGSGHSISVLDVFNIIKEKMNSPKEVMDNDEVRRNEIMDTVANISLAKTYLGWTPKYDFESAIDRILSLQNQNSSSKS